MVSMNIQEVFHLKNKEVGVGGSVGGGLIPNWVTVVFYDWQVLWDQDTPQPDCRWLWDAVQLCLYVKSLPSKQWLILHENLVQMSHNGSEWQSLKTMQQDPPLIRITVNISQTLHTKYTWQILYEKVPLVQIKW